MAVEQCSFDEIRNYFEKEPREFTSEELTKILNTKEIDEAKAISTAKNFYSELNENIGQYHCQEILDLLNKTNSERLLTGETAKENIQKIESVRDDLSKIMEDADRLDDTECGIPSIVEMYNSTLKTVKNGAKIQLLRQLADNINDEAENCRPTYLLEKTQTTVVQNNLWKFKVGAEIGDLKWQWYEIKELGLKRDSNGAAVTGASGESIQEYELTKYVVPYCNYWANSPVGKHSPAWYNPFTWGDDTREELEEKIKKISELTNGKVQMPYDTSK